MSKTRKRIIIIFAIIALVILLFPFPFGIHDGGSFGFSAILYEIVFWRPMEGGERGISINLFRLFEFYFSAE